MRSAGHRSPLMRNDACRPTERAAEEAQSRGANRGHGQPLTADYFFSFFKSPHAKAFIVTPSRLDGGGIATGWARPAKVAVASLCRLDVTRMRASRLGTHCSTSLILPPVEFILGGQDRNPSRTPVTQSPCSSSAGRHSSAVPL